MNSPHRGSVRLLRSFEKYRRLLVSGALGLSVSLLVGVTSVEKYRTGVYDLNSHRISLHWKNSSDQPYRSLALVKKDLEENGTVVVALANAGIYGRNYAPLGLHVENGRVLRKLNRARGGGNFFLKPNGVFLIGPKGARILRTEKLARKEKIFWATQSGPLLFDEKGIHPKFDQSSKSRYIRNAIGVRKDGKVVLAISRVPVTFWDLATFMKKEMNCTAALYLDGSISLMWREGERMPQGLIPFVGIIAVSRIEQPQKK